MPRNDDLIYKKNLEKRFASVCRKTYTRTINFDNTMTAAEMQAMVDALHKYIPHGHELTFQFADGTYTMTDQLVIAGFYGGGIINIYGNTGDGTSQSTAQSVYLDFAGQDCNGIVFTGCSVRYIYVRNLKIRVKSTTATNYAVRTVYSSSIVLFYYGYLLGTGTTHSVGFEAWSGRGSLYRNYMSNIYCAIRCYLIGHVFSKTDDDTGVMPLYGLMAYDGGVIAKSGSQPDGSTADEFTASGGVIR